MPIEINDLENGKGIEYLASGTLTGREIIEANRQVYRPDILEHLDYKVIDRTRCEKYEVTSGEIRSIVEQDVEASARKPGLVILLVSITQVQYGMSRMWQTLTHEANLDVRHFRSRAEADACIAQSFRPT